MRSLIIYATQEGQTQQIAQRIARRLRRHGIACDTYSVVQYPADEIAVDAYDAVIFGSPLHYAQHDANVAQCVTDFTGHLQKVPSAFFSVSLGIVSKKSVDRKEARDLATEFTQSLGWQPDLNQCFAGALKYSRYGWLKKRVMQWIARQNDSETDLSRDQEHTDWEVVDQFADAFAKLVERRKNTGAGQPQAKALS